MKKLLLAIIIAAGIPSCCDEQPPRNKCEELFKERSQILGWYDREEKQRRLEEVDSLISKYCSKDSAW